MPDEQEIEGREFDSTNQAQRVNVVAGTVTTTPSGTQTVQGAVTTSPTASATGTQTSVASSASSVTVLAANSARRGASVYADSIGSATLYLLLHTGGTATSSAYSVALTATAPYFEVPAGYTGAIIGIWSAANGAAKVTEYAA